MMAVAVAGTGRCCSVVLGDERLCLSEPCGTWLIRRLRHAHLSDSRRDRAIEVARMLDCQLAAPEQRHVVKIDDARDLDLLYVVVDEALRGGHDVPAEISALYLILRAGRRFG